MKTIACLLLSVSFAFSQTTDKEALVVYLPKGKSMAEVSYLKQGGAYRLSAYREFVYTIGPIKGLTKAKALEKFEETWKKSSAETRMMWAKRAMATGTTEIVEPEKKAGKTGIELMEEARQRDQAKRLKDLERAEHNRKVQGL